MLATRRAQYVADIRQVPPYIRAHQTRHAQELLSRHEPRPGEEDLREFTWYHLWKRCHMSRRTLSGHEGGAYFVEFSPRGDLLASAGKDGTVRIWDTASWQLIRTIEASSKEVNVAAYSPDGKILATVDDEGKLKLWDSASGRCQLEVAAHTGDAVIARFSPDGHTIVTGGRTDGFIKIWDRATGKMLDSIRASERHLENAVFSPDGSLLACACQRMINVWRISDRKTIATYPTGDDNQGIAFSHDGAMLAAASESECLIRLWEVSTGRPLREFRGHTSGVFSVAFSRDDQTIISASDDHSIRLWDVATGQERGLWLGHTSRVWTIAIAPDGRSVASASDDGTVKIWDSDPRVDRYQLRVPVPANFCFSPDGRTLITLEVGPQWAVARWDVRSRSLLQRTPLKLAGCVCSAFSPDGRLLAFARNDGVITLCDLATGQEQQFSDLALTGAYRLEFSPESSYLLAYSTESGRKLLWDIKRPLLDPVSLDRGLCSVVHAVRRSRSSKPGSSCPNRGAQNGANRDRFAESRAGLHGSGSLV